jgi:hypothetical protein
MGTAIYAALCHGSRGNQSSDPRVVAAMARNNSTSNAQRDRRLPDCALASAKIIQFAPYLARKREQEVQRLLARRIRHSPIVEGDIRAWVAAMIEWSARY